MSALELAAVAHGGVAATFTLVCAFASRARASSPGVARPRVILLRPLEAMSPAVAARLALDPSAYSGELVRVVCSPARVELPEGIRGAVSDVGELDAVNRKAAHLTAGWALVRDELRDDDVVVHADSDVRLEPGDLDALVAALSGPLALAFAPPAPSGTTPLRRRLAQAIMALSPQAFAAVAALGRMTGSPPAIAGKLVAQTGALLRALDGYRCMLHAIGDDVALVEAARAQRATVSMSSRAAQAEAAMTTPQLFAQLTRWLRVIAAHRPHLLLTYPLFVAPLPVTAALALAAWSPRAGLSLLGLLVARLVLGSVLARGAYAGRVRLVNVLLCPLADLLLLGALARSLTSHTIVWAGRSYRVGRGGRILSVSHES